MSDVRVRLDGKFFRLGDRKLWGFPGPSTAASWRARRTKSAAVGPSGKRLAPATVGVFAEATCFLVYRQSLTGLTEATATLSAGIELKRFRALGMPEAKALAFLAVLWGLAVAFFVAAVLAQADRAQSSSSP